MENYSEENLCQMMFRVPEDLKIKFQIVALQKQVSMSAMFREFMQEEVEKANLS